MEEEGRKVLLIVRGGAFRCRNAVTLGLHRMHLRLNWKFWIVSSTNIFTECHKIYLKVLIDKSWDPKLHLSMLLLKRAALSFLLNKKYNFKTMRNPRIPSWGCSEEKSILFEKLPGWNSVIQTLRSNGIYIYVNWADKVYFLERGQFSENLHLLTSAETIVVIDKILQIMTFIFNEYHILVLSVIVTKWKYFALVCWYKMGPFLIQLQLYYFIWHCIISHRLTYCNERLAKIFSYEYFCHRGSIYHWHCLCGSDLALNWYKTSLTPWTKAR